MTLFWPFSSYGTVKAMLITIMGYFNHALQFLIIQIKLKSYIIESVMGLCNTLVNHFLILQARQCFLVFNALKVLSDCRDRSS